MNKEEVIDGRMEVLQCMRLFEVAVEVVVVIEEAESAMSWKQSQGRVSVLQRRYLADAKYNL